MRKYFYFFRGDLRSHVDIFLAWVNSAQEYIPIRMVTALPLVAYYRQKELVTHYRSLGVKIYAVPSPLITLFFTFYFLIQSIGTDRVVVHLRKQHARPVLLAKKLFKNKFSYVVEIEGDPVSEADYLKHHPYKEGFYQQLRGDKSEMIADLGGQIRSADGVLVVTEELKNVLMQRYGISERDKFCVLPTGFDSRKFFFDESLRDNKRKELGIEDMFAVIFVGNVYYSWQNIKSTIDIFNEIKVRDIYNSPVLILLVRERDQPIAKEFIEKKGLSDNDYILKSVPHDEINAYLNASDLGMLLRDNHTMNRVASPGKMGEYLASGIDVLTTPYIGTYSAPMLAAEIGVIVDDFRDMNSVLAKLCSGLRKRDRHEISIWARDTFSSQGLVQRYVQFLQRV